MSAKTSTSGQRRQRLGLQTAAVALLVVAVGTGCTHSNPVSLSLNGNILATREFVGAGVVGECYPEGNGRYRSHGTLDLMVANEYHFFPEVENLMPDTTIASGNNVQQLRSDASTVTVTGAEVSLSFNKSGPLANFNPPASLTTWYVPVAGLIQAAGVWRGRFTLLPSNLGEALRAAFAADPNRYTTSHSLVITVAIEGEMQDGTVVKTQSLKFPVDLCWGCLVSLPVATPGVGVVDPADQYAWCTQKEVNPEFIPPCVPGNDEFVPCSYYCHVCDLDATCDDLVCPAS
jgi:hypothetical protein